MHINSLPSRGLFTCSSRQGSLRLSRPMTLSFPLVERGLSRKTAFWGRAVFACLKSLLQILGPVGAGESSQLWLWGLEGWKGQSCSKLNVKPYSDHQESIQWLQSNTLRMGLSGQKSSIFFMVLMSRFPMAICKPVSSPRLLDST